MSNIHRFSAAVMLLTVVSCSRMGEKVDVKQSFLPNAPATTETNIRKAFPTAVPGHVFADSILARLRTKYNITPDKMLLGASTCVDDIIYTKNFHLHPEIKGPFHLGGLAGLPFTGISGLEALVHHVPENGALILLVEPHIGYSDQLGWGYVLRHEQHEPSSCCGALMGTLGKLKSGSLPEGISEDDYQGGKIAEMVRAHQKEILEAENPILELTRLTSREADEQISAHVAKVDLGHVNFLIIVTGVIINTDYSYTDYQYVSRWKVVDLHKNQVVEDVEYH